MRLAWLFVICFGCVAIGQKRKITIIDSSDKTPLEAVNISIGSDRFFKTDASGNAAFKAKDEAIVSVSMIGYLSVKTEAANLPDTLRLEQNPDRLDEVVIGTKTIEFLRPKKALGQLNPRNFGDGGAPLSPNEMTAIFIPNQTGHNYKLRSVSLEPTDYSLAFADGNGKSVKQNDQKYAPFRVQIYSVDPEYQIPLQPLLTDEIVVSLNRGKKHAVAVLSEEIEISSTGFFITIQPMDAEFYKNNGFRSSPAFQKIQASKDLPYLVLTKNLAIEDSIWRQTTRNRDYNQVIWYELEVVY